MLVLKHKSMANYAFIQDVVCRTLTYIIAKKKNDWTENQKERAASLFALAIYREGIQTYFRI